MDIWQVGSRKVNCSAEVVQNPTTYKNWRDGFFTFCLKMILPRIWLWQLQELVFAQKFWGAQGLNSKIARHSLLPCSFIQLPNLWPKSDLLILVETEAFVFFSPRSQPLQNNKTQSSIFAKWAPGEDRHFDHHFDVHEADGIVKTFGKIWWLWLTEWITRPWENSICWWKKSYNPPISKCNNFHPN